MNKPVGTKLVEYATACTLLSVPVDESLVDHVRNMLDALREDVITREKAVHWFACLEQCAKLLGLPSDKPIPSGTIDAVQYLLAEHAEAVAALKLAQEALEQSRPVTRNYGPALDRQSAAIKACRKAIK
jgi:hypothetical protein